MTEQPQINLVAVVGQGGAIGPSDGLPEMMYEAEAMWFENWFVDLTRGGVIVLGHKSMEWMNERGGAALSKDHMLVVWTRDATYDPDQFLAALQEIGKPIFICGGFTTYQTFMPYVQQFFIRRVALKAPHDNYMPPLFGRTQ